MATTLIDLNRMPYSQATALLFKCCTAKQWIEQMEKTRPFDSVEQMVTFSTKIWNALQSDSWLQAFAGHPKIGDTSSIEQKFADTSSMAKSEQSGTASATSETLVQLKKYNQSYLDKFGYIFIICASGKSADQMLESLKARYQNNPSDELQVAANEQIKITNLRIQKLIT